jgi:hypothetical protein
VGVSEVITEVLCGMFVLESIAVENERGKKGIARI